MAGISSQSQKWLKCIHVFSACLWVGGAISLFTITNFINDIGGGLYTRDIIIKFIDDIIIVPGAIGLMLTGLVYSVFTNWGWIKHKWIIVKWLINLFGIILGTFWLGPWVNSLSVISKSEGISALSSPVYAHSLIMMRAWGAFLLTAIIFALFISSLKPWRKKQM